MVLAVVFDCCFTNAVWVCLSMRGSIAGTLRSFRDSTVLYSAIGDMVLTDSTNLCANQQNLECFHCTTVISYVSCQQLR